MLKTLSLALMLTALPAASLAAPVTISTTLAEHGFSDGMLLSAREAGSFYLPLPAGVDISNVRIKTRAQAVVPNLNRGSLVLSVNGQPVDALRLSEGASAHEVGLDTLLREGDALRAQALELRFRADLIAQAEMCSEEFDAADTLQVLPETSISFDVDLERVTALGDALALLSKAPVVQVAQPLTPETAAAALKLGSALANKGYRAIYSTAGEPEGPVHLRVAGTGTGPAMRLLHEKGALVIEIAADADLSALTRLWLAAPAVLAGDAVTASSPGIAGSAPPSGFIPFPTLPSALRVLDTGAMGLDFTMLDVNGRRANQARLRLVVAPDWSDVNPVATFYLNGQLVAAERLQIGETIVEVPLPADLQRLNNRLSVAIDRARTQTYCQGASPGHPVQMLPGSGVAYGDGAMGGFAQIAALLRSGGGVVQLPNAAMGVEAEAYLGLATRLLTGLGVGLAPVPVIFEGTTPAAGSTVLAFARSSADGLTLPIATNRGRPDVEFSTNAALASVVADPLARRLDIRVLDGQKLPDPQAIYLGNSGKALIGDSGVIWEDTPSGTDPSLVQRAREASRDLLDILRMDGLFWGLIGIGAILVVILARALLKRYFQRRAAR